MVFWFIVLIFLVFSFFMIKEVILDANDVIDFFLTGFLYFMVIGLFVFVSGITGLVGADITDRVSLDHKEHYCNIVSLKSISQISGRFTLGTGYIQQKRYFRAFKKVSENSYETVSVPTEDSTLTESDKKDPHIVKYHYRRLGNFWIAPQWVTDLVMSHVHRYCLYIPKGTIIREFKPQ